MTRSGSGAHEHSRAIAGGRASAATPTRYAPLRAIRGGVAGSGGLETLECGHTMRARHDMIGTTYTSSRRCLQCLFESCSTAGHILDIVRGTSPSCKCGVADGAASHLAHHSRLMYGDEVRRQWSGLPYATLVAEHLALHDSTPTSDVDHWHWKGDIWGVRTRPEKGLP
jgi:hypothetical protein